MYGEMMKDIPNKEESKKQVIQCLECQTGYMHLKNITYFTWLNGELITVPNFPAWVCDVCGRCECDRRAISWLNTLLHPETGKKVARKLNYPPVSDVSHKKKLIFPE